MDEIPTVDFSSLSLSFRSETLKERDLKAAAEPLMNAFTTFGIARISNAGLNEQLLRDVADTATDFFELPVETKRSYAYGGPEMHGWMAVEQETGDESDVGDLKENFDVNLRAVHDESRWPREIPRFKPLTLKCFEMFTELAHRVMLAVAYGLNLEDVNFFRKCHNTFLRPSGSSLRLLWYPPIPEKIIAGQQRLHSHTDFGSITFLLQLDHGGLEAKTREGRWMRAEPIANTVLVMTGDLIQRWTANRIMAVVHRVLNPESEAVSKSVRRCIAFFFHPDGDFVIRCLDGSDTYETITDDQYYARRESETVHYRTING